MKDYEMKSVWDFVQEYYPDYTSSDEIAYNDDLAKLVEDDYTEDEYDHAYKKLINEYGGDIENPQIKIDYESSCAQIFERSIEAFIERKKDVVEIVWSVADVKHHAETIDIYITDEDARGVLELMKERYDPDAGINWSTLSVWITYYLGEKRKARKG